MSKANIRIYSFIILLPLRVACSSYRFIVDKSSFDKWYSIPNNAQFLKLKVYSDSDLHLIKGRSYYLTLLGCNVFTMSLVEVPERDGIMNVFPLPAHPDTPQPL